MRKFFVELYRRNPWLSIAGWISLIFAIICAVLTQFSTVQVMGINAFFKPMKFFLSICIFVWTMGWFMYYLQKLRAALAYSIMLILVFVLEMYVITWQAANGRLSHFNNDTPIYRLLFALMGLAIMVLWTWTLVITIFFFLKKDILLPRPYMWGIRIGLLLFVLFSIEGGMMVMRLSHTVGAPDGSPGLPLVNWSKQYGDLRIAHFLGMHALQIIPLFAFFVAKNVRTVIVFSAVYFIFASALFIQAMKAVPLFF